jgi:putative transposase
MEPSAGTVGVSYDNAPAESVIGLFKTEVIRRRGPWRGVEAVEFARLEWVAWFNRHRLPEPIGYVPPVEYEELSAPADSRRGGGSQLNRSPGNPGRFQQCSREYLGKGRLAARPWSSRNVGLHHRGHPAIPGQPGDTRTTSRTPADVSRLTLPRGSASYLAGAATRRLRMAASLSRIICDE